MSSIAHCREGMWEVIAQRQSMVQFTINGSAVYEQKGFLASLGLTAESGNIFIRKFCYMGSEVDE